MITIHNEVTIECGDPHEQSITLWLVSYGQSPGNATLRDWPRVLNALRHACAEKGWMLETGDDPYQEKSLGVFAPGFSWPPDDEDEAEEGFVF